MNRGMYRAFICRTLTIAIYVSAQVGWVILFADSLSAFFREKSLIHL